MADASQRAAWTFRGLLLFLLLVQSCLLFYRLDLLPVWGDEQFTLHVIQRPWAEIPPILRADIHPPVYYFLLRAWTNLPWPGTLIEQARGFSALVALLSTVLFYALWLRKKSATLTMWFLALWVLSPTLLLYSRMARSYSLQLFAAILAAYAAVAFLRDPRSRRWLLAYVAAAVLLLYIHYLPGLAIAGAVAVLLALRCGREKSRPLAKRWVAVNALIVILYLPWLATLAHALTRVSEADPYFLVDNFALETIVKLVYWFTSFTFGESFPAWAIALGVVLGPGVAWLLRSGARPAPSWGAVAGVTAVIAYLGATAWVSFPFVGARLLFLLPFYVLWLARGREAHPRFGTLILGGILVVSIGARTSYFQKRDFLNQGYLVPFGEIAEQIEQHTAGRQAVVLVDGYNTDPTPLLAALEGRATVIKIRGEAAMQQAQHQIQKGEAEVVWFLRNTHDVSPGGVVSALENELILRYDPHPIYYVPYSPADRFAAGMLSWPAEPAFHYQLTEFRKRAEGSVAISP